MIEIAAKAVFEHWQFAKPVDPVPAKGMPAWVDGGNSLMQDKARDFASTAIHAYIDAHQKLALETEPEEESRFDRALRDAFNAGREAEAMDQAREAATP